MKRKQQTKFSENTERNRFVQDLLRREDDYNKKKEEEAQEKIRKFFEKKEEVKLNYKETISFFLFYSLTRKTLSKKKCRMRRKSWRSSMHAKVNYFKIKYQNF
jgi:hypothetical protein